MNKSIWVRQSETMLNDLGFRTKEAATPRKLRGTFTMAIRYSIPESDVTQVIELLSESDITHEVE